MESIIQQEVGALYQQLIASWNKRDAAAFANLLTVDANLIGFDGSQMNSKNKVQTTLTAIFTEHETAPFVTKVQEIRLLNPNTVLLRAIVSMPTKDGTDINPNVNAIQSLLAVKGSDGWQIALFQNTPAQFHGKPELKDEMTEELRAVLFQNKLQ